MAKITKEQLESLDAETLNGLGSTQFLRSDTDDTMDGELTVNGDVTIVDTTSDSSAGPEFSLKRDDAAPADANYLGQLRFDGRNDNGNNRLYAKITGKIGRVCRLWIVPMDLKINRACLGEDSEMACPSRWDTSLLGGCNCTPAWEGGSKFSSPPKIGCKMANLWGKTDFESPHR